MNSRIFALITLVLKTLPANAQDTTRTAEPDLDTMTSGPSFAFTGREDPQLLALVFRRTYELAERPNGTTIVCLGLGRRNTVNAPAPVVQALLSNDMSARPHSACTIAPGFRHFKVTESSTGKLAFLIHITSIAHKRGDNVVVYSTYYVGVLWASGFACPAWRERGQWALGTCKRRWIS